MASRPIEFLFLLAMVCLSACCWGAKMEITSTAFQHQQKIPAIYTCDGKDISPPLVWKNAPANVKSFALIVDDPDAPRGTWVHWVMWNIPKPAASLAENQSRGHVLRDGSRQGTGDSGNVGYSGPCPPSGTHRYFFKLFALDKELSLPATTTKGQLETAMKGHVLAQAELVGLYKR